MAASALEEPEQPPMNVDSTTLTCAMPPLMCPATCMESLIRRLVIPELFIKLPAKMNRGTASSVTLWVWLIGS